MAKMRASVYLNNDRMQLVWSSGDSKGEETIALPEGSVLNGVLIRTDGIVEQLKKWHDELNIKAITLLVDSNNIHAKKMVLPTLPRKTLLPIVSNEFELENKGDYFFDYTILEKGERDTIVIGCAAPIELVEKYLKCFDEAKISVKGVRLVLDAMIQYVMESPDLQDQSVLLNVVYGYTLFTVLFDKGMFTFFNRNRLMYEEGTDGFIEELYNKLSYMVQFSKSQQSESVIKKSLYAGISEETLQEFKEYTEELQPLLGIVHIDSKEMPSNYFYPYLSMACKKLEIDLKKVRKNALEKSTAYVKPVLIGLVSVLCAGLIVMWYWNEKQIIASLNSEIAACDMYLTSPDVAQQLKQVEEVNASIKETEQLLGYYEEINYLLSTYDYLETDTLKAIYSNLPIDSFAYNASNGAMSVDGMAEVHEDATLFMTDLRNQIVVDEMYYNSYQVTYEDETIIDSDTLPEQFLTTWQMSGTWDVMPLYEDYLANLETIEADTVEE